MNYTYMLKCGDGSLYTGWTNDLARRVKTHAAGKGGKYTKSRLPVTLIYFEAYDDKREAMSREALIKRLTRAEKLELIKGFDAEKLRAFDISADNRALNSAI